MSLKVKTPVITPAKRNQIRKSPEYEHDGHPDIENVEEITHAFTFLRSPFRVCLSHTGFFLSCVLLVVTR
jgi:hypothetical protein